MAKPFKPRKHQTKAIKYVLERACAAIFADPGAGKTSIFLAALLILIKKKLVGKVLLIAPLRVCASVWPKEAKKWIDFNGLRMVFLHGPKKDELLDEEADIYLINPEGLDWLLQPKKTKRGSKTSVTVDVRRFKKLGFDVLAIDELTKFKNHRSIRFKMMKLVVGTFRRRYGFTGSPGAKGLEWLFGQVYMIDEGNALGRYVSHYHDAFFVPNFNGFGVSLQEGAEERIYERLAPVVLRLEAEGYDLPQLVENIIPITLPPAAKKVHDELMKDLLSEIDSGTVTAKNVGVALGKCRQVASGAIYNEAGLGELVKTRKTKRDWTLVHDEKLDALEDIVEELQGSPLFVAYEFQHDLERLQERFGKDLPYIGAGVSTKRGLELEAAWNAGELPVLAAHPMSVAHGLNLQESGQHVAWFTLTWDYENYDQFIRRILRQGSKHKRVFVHLLIGEGTADELVLNSLRARRKGQEALFTGLKTLQTRRRK